MPSASLVCRRGGSEEFEVIGSKFHKDNGPEIPCEMVSEDKK